MRVARLRWFLVVIATIVLSSTWSGGALAQDTEVPFRRACDLVTPAAVSAILGVEVTPADEMRDAWCSYLQGDRPVASVGLDPNRPLVLAGGATDVTVGGLPGQTSAGVGSTSVVTVRLPDGGVLFVGVDEDAGFDSPLGAAQSLVETILATGPVTAHAIVSTAEPISHSGSPCDLVTPRELERLTGERFTRIDLDVNEVRCRYRTKDRKAEVSVSVGAGHLGILRSDQTRDLTVDGRPALFSPETRFLAVHLGAGQVLGVRVDGARGVKAEDLPALRAAIAETAIARMTPGGVTCPLISTDAILAASGLDLRPIAEDGPDSCEFVTPDEQTGLFLRVASGRGRDVAYARRTFRSGFADQTTRTDLVVSGHPASGATGTSGTRLLVDVDATGRERTALFAALYGSYPSVTDPLSVLEAIAEVVLGGP